MSDYSSMATLQNNSQTAGFATAVQRARLVAAKLGGGKRSLEDGPEPTAKKVAPVEPAYQQQPQPQHQVMSGPASSGGPPMGGPGARPPQAPAPPNVPPNLMADQSVNDYIRVPDKMVGLIIGRGGEQITRLQAESGCKIQMAPDSGGQPDRLCTLTGSREAIQRAKELVNQIVNHRGRENAPQHQDGQGGGGVPAPPMIRGGGPTTDEIMLPGPKVGLIIGKNGKTIKQLQEQSGAKMIVIQEGPNTEYEKPLRISGDPAKVEHAKQLVFELLADKDIQTRYDDGGFNPDQGGNGLATNSTEVLVPKLAVGVVIGRGGDMIKKIQADTGARVQFHQERDEGPGDKRCYLQGKPHQVQQAKQMIEDLISSVNEVRSNRGRGGSGQRNGDRPPDFAQQWQETPEVRVTFTVSNVKCGLIIGRGGEVIKQINAQSGAHCELDRRAQGMDRNNRTFYIKGHPEAVEQCKRIIMEKVGMPVNFVQDNGNGNGNNDGNGGGNGGNGNGNGGGGGGGGSEYYGVGAPGAWGYNPHWHQQSVPQQQQPQVAINPATGQPDYSQQWIDYYRSMGYIHEAEVIEQQVKQSSGGVGQSEDGSPTQGGPSTPGPSTTQVGDAPAPPAAQANPQPDYSAQWAEYYRNMGKIKEAEAIEAQIKLKQAQQMSDQPVQMQQPAATPSPAPSASSQNANPMMAQYGAPQYSMYASGVYPGYGAYQYPGGGVQSATTPDPNQQ